MGTASRSSSSSGKKRNTTRKNTRRMTTETNLMREADALQLDSEMDYEYRLPDFTLHTQLQIALFCFAVFIWVTHLIIIIWPLWALMNSAVSAPTLGAIFLFKGIFVQCLQYMPGQFQCDNFLRPVFSLSAVQIVLRSFAILSIFCGAISLILLLFGMECTKTFLQSPRIKVSLMKAAAIWMSIAASMLLVVGSMYATSLAQNFHASELVQSNIGSIFSGKANFDVDSIRYELGGCLYASFCVVFLEYLLAVAVYLFRGFVNERKMSVAEHQDKEQAYEEKLKALMKNKEMGAYIF